MDTLGLELLLVVLLSLRSSSEEAAAAATSLSWLFCAGKALTTRSPEEAAAELSTTSLSWLFSPLLLTVIGGG